jgi:hypothetical protein
MPFGNCSASECVAVTATRIRVPGPDRAARPAAGPEEYRVEAHFSGVRRRVFGVKWPDPPTFETSEWHCFSLAPHV